MNVTEADDTDSTLPLTLWFLRMNPALLSLSRSKENGFQEKEVFGTVQRASAFQKPLLKVEGWVRKGGGKEGLINRQRREEIKVIPTLIHKLLQTIPELHVFALLPQSHSPAFMPSLLK